VREKRGERIFCLRVLNRELFFRIGDWGTWRAGEGKGETADIVENVGSGLSTMVQETSKSQKASGEKKKVISRKQWGGGEGAYRVGHRHWSRNNCGTLLARVMEKSELMEKLQFSTRNSTRNLFIRREGSSLRWN